MRKLKTTGETKQTKKFKTCIFRVSLIHCSVAPPPGPQGAGLDLSVLRCGWTERGLFYRHD